MKITNTGLKYFWKEKEALSIDVELLLGTVNSDSGHLGDIISSLRTISASINLKADTLNEYFKKQKNEN